jgi:predicted amidohydrolase YtcJ
MTLRTNLNIAVFSTVLFLSACGRQTTESEVRSADLVFINGRIYTVDTKRSWAQAVAVHEGKIVYVGDDAGAQDLVTGNTQLVDLQGKMLLPGFQDVHSHFAAAGVHYLECPVFDLGNKEAVLAAIKKCSDENPTAEIIRGVGWTIDQFENGRPPRKELLDAIDTSRPLVFGDADGHAFWLNTAAFETYGITRDTADPKGGKIERDPETGELWGTLHEDSGMELIKSQWPPYSDEDFIAGIRYSENHYHSLGITAIQDPLVKLNGRGEYRSLPAYQTLNDRGELNVRVSASLFWEAEKGLEQIEAFKKARRETSAGRLRVNTVKFWADGVLETHTAMLLESYADKPETRGLMMVPREQLMSGIPLLDAEGFQVHIHAIGDATVRYSLDAIEAAWQANGRRDARHHITHAQVVHPDDIPRFQALGVGASFQPYWTYADEYVTLFNFPRLGPDRIKLSYPIGSLQRSGATVAFSSDWFVSSANPLVGIETAVTHVDPLTNKGQAFLPSETIALDEAVAAYTINAAYLNAIDDMTGSIQVGKYADLIVLDQDLFAIPIQEVSDVQVLLTLLEGDVMYGNLEDF